MKALLILLLVMSQRPQSSTLTVADCHLLIGASIQADYAKISFGDMSKGRIALGRCVSEHGEELTKIDLMGSFAALQFIDNEISKRITIEVAATKASILQAQKECESK